MPHGAADAEERRRSAQRKIRKFLARSEDGIGAPIKALRDPNNGMIGMTLTVNRPTLKVPFPQPTITYPQLEKRLLDSVIVECRVFFLATEDCYLPGVVKSLKSLAGPDRARLFKPLTELVSETVRNGRLYSVDGGGMVSGRLEMDNGLGPNQLLGSDQIAMDYIYGVALHEDDDRLARLENVSSAETVNLAVVLQLNNLLNVVEVVRQQVVHDLDTGYVTLN